MSKLLLNVGVAAIVVFCAIVFWQNRTAKPTTHEQPTDTQPVDTQPVDEGEDSPEWSFGLRKAPGRDHVIRNCLPCHSGAIIAANHLSRDSWEKVIDQMQKQNGMRPLPPATRTAILNYLETAQRPEDRGLSEGKKSPWATPLYRPNPIWK